MQFARKCEVGPKGVSLSGGSIRHDSNGTTGEDDLVVFACQTAHIEVVGHDSDKTVIHAVQNKRLNLLRRNGEGDRVVIGRVISVSKKIGGRRVGAP